MSFYVVAEGPPTDATVVQVPSGRIEPISLRDPDTHELLHATRLERWYDPSDTPVETMWFELDFSDVGKHVELSYYGLVPGWEDVTQDTVVPDSIGPNANLVYERSTDGQLLMYDFNNLSLGPNWWGPWVFTPIYGFIRAGGFDPVVGYNWTEPNRFPANVGTKIWLRVEVPTGYDDDLWALLGFTARARDEVPSKWWQWQPDDDRVNGVVGHGIAHATSNMVAPRVPVPAASMLIQDYAEHDYVWTRDYLFGYNQELGPFQVGPVTQRADAWDFSDDMYIGDTWNINHPIEAGDDGKIVFYNGMNTFWSCFSTGAFGYFCDEDGSGLTNTNTLEAGVTSELTRFSGEMWPADIALATVRPGSVFTVIANTFASMATARLEEIDRTTGALITDHGLVLDLLAPYIGDADIWLMGVHGSVDGSSLEFMIGSRDADSGLSDNLALLVRWDVTTFTLSASWLPDMAGGSSVRQRWLGRTPSGKLVVENPTGPTYYIVRELDWAQPEVVPLVHEPDYDTRGYNLLPQGFDDDFLYGAYINWLKQGDHTWIDGVEYDLGSTTKADYFAEVVKWAMVDPPPALAGDLLVLGAADFAETSGDGGILRAGDRFDRPDSVDLADGAPFAWEKLQASGDGFTVYSGTADQSDVVAGLPYAAAFFDHTSAACDFTLEISGVGPIARGTSDLSSFLMARTDGLYEITTDPDVANPVATLVGLYAGGEAFYSSAKVRLQCAGTQINVWVDDILVGTFTSSFNLTETRIGFYSHPEMTSSSEFWVTYFELQESTGPDPVGWTVLEGTYEVVADADVPSPWAKASTSDHVLKVTGNWDGTDTSAGDSTFRMVSDPVYAINGTAYRDWFIGLARWMAVGGDYCYVKVALAYYNEDGSFATGGDISAFGGTTGYFPCLSWQHFDHIVGADAVYCVFEVTVQLGASDGVGGYLTGPADGHCYIGLATLSSFGPYSSSPTEGPEDNRFWPVTESAFNVDCARLSGELAEFGHDQIFVPTNQYTAQEWSFEDGTYGGWTTPAGLGGVLSVVAGGEDGTKALRLDFDVLGEVYGPWLPLDVAHVDYYTLSQRISGFTDPVSGPSGLIDYEWSNDDGSYTGNSTDNDLPLYELGGFGPFPLESRYYDNNSGWVDSWVQTYYMYPSYFNNATKFRVRVRTGSDTGGYILIDKATALPGFSTGPVYKDPSIPAGYEEDPSWVSIASGREWAFPGNGYGFGSLMGLPIPFDASPRRTSVYFDMPVTG